MHHPLAVFFFRDTQGAFIQLQDGFINGFLDHGIDAHGCNLCTVFKGGFNNGFNVLAHSIYSTEYRWLEVL